MNTNGQRLLRMAAVATLPLLIAACSQADGTARPEVQADFESSVRLAMSDISSGRDFQELQPEAVAILNECLSDSDQPSADVPSGYFGAGPALERPDLFASDVPVSRGFGYASQMRQIWFSGFGLASDGETPLFEDGDPNPRGEAEPTDEWRSAVQSCLPAAQAHVDRFGYSEAVFAAALAAREGLSETIDSSSELVKWGECMGDFVASGDDPAALAAHYGQRVESAIQAHAADMDLRDGEAPDYPSALQAASTSLMTEENAAAAKHRACLESSGLSARAMEARDAAIERAQESE